MRQDFNIDHTLTALVLAALPQTPEGVLTAFGDHNAFFSALSGISRIDAKNGPIVKKAGLDESDLFRAIPDSEPFYAEKLFERLALRWEKTRPSLPAVAYAWLHRLRLAASTCEQQKKLNNAVLLAAVRAEMVRGKPAPDNTPQPDEPAYHSRLHFLHVLQATCHLIEVNDGLSDKKAVTLTNRDKTLLMLAALVHDLDHPGGGNVKDKSGKFILYQIEDKSFAIADKLFEACGLSEEERGIIHTLLRATDPNGPHKFMKDAMKAHEANQNISLSDIVPGEEERCKDLAPLLAGKKLCYMAAILSDADLFSSAGAGLRMNQINSEKFTQEKRGAGEPDCDLTTPEARVHFCNNIVGETGFASAAGRAAFNASFGKMLRETFAEIEAAKKAQEQTPALKQT